MMMREVTVTYHHDGSSWWADSTDLDGYTAVAASLEELRPLVADGVAFYLNDAPHIISEQLDSGGLLADGVLPR
jgi:predicted RNase H-like HicB family nuclease